MDNVKQSSLLYNVEVADLYYFVLKVRSENAPPYDIKTSFPNKVYDDPTASLQECGLAPNATLHSCEESVTSLDHDVMTSNGMRLST